MIDAEPNGDTELVVKSVDGPDSVKPMFANLVLHTADTKPGPKQVLFKIRADFVTAFKLVPATEPLSPAEARLAEPDPSSEQVMMIPIFKYQVKSYGVLVRTGQRIRFVPSQWADATYVRISNAPEDRIEIAPVARSLQMASKPTPGRRVRLPDVPGYSPILTELAAPLLPAT